VFHALGTVVRRVEIRDGGTSRGEGDFDEVGLLLWRRVDKAFPLFAGEESYWSKLRSIIQYVTEYSSKTY